MKVVARAGILSVLVLSTVVVFVFVLFEAGWGEKKIDLGGGFTYVQLDGRNWAIVHGSAVVVEPNVVNCKVASGFIVGERGDPQFEEPALFSKEYGHFIYDTKTKVLMEGLTKEGFIEALGRRGIVTDLPYADD